MKHAAVYTSTEGATVVIASSRWRWFARLRAHWFWRNNPHLAGVRLAEVDDSAQVIINICEHRDQVMATCQELEEKIEELLARHGSEHPAVTFLFSLVSKDELGNWTTVHDADTQVDAEMAAFLEDAVQRA